jgi:hypothetical protein
MMDNNSLVVFEKINPVALFTEEEVLCDFIAQIRKKAFESSPGIETVEARKKTASLAYQVSRSKTLIDDAGKTLVADWKAKAKKVDQSRKAIRDAMDEIRDEIRKPLTDYENAEKEIMARDRAIEEYNQDLDDAIAEHGLWLRQKDVEKREAKLVREEAERIAEENRLLAEKEKKELEERLQREAAEKAKREGEQQIKEEAALKAQAVKEAQEEAEVERLAQEKKIAGNKTHQKKINNIAMKAFVENGISENIAKAVLKLIILGEIPNVKVNY